MCDYAGRMNQYEDHETFTSRLNLGTIRPYNVFLIIKSRGEKINCNRKLDSKKIEPAL